MGKSQQTPTNFGAILSSLRERRGLTQAELAIRADVTTSTISRQENMAELKMRKRAFCRVVLICNEIKQLNPEEAEAIRDIIDVSMAAPSEPDAPQSSVIERACDLAVKQLILVAGPTGALKLITAALETAENGEDDEGGTPVLGTGQPRPRNPGGLGSPFLPIGPNGRVPLMPIRQPPSGGGSQNKPRHKAFHRGDLGRRHKIGYVKLAGRLASPLVPDSYRIDGNTLRSNSPRIHNTRSSKRRHRHARNVDRQ